MTKEYTGNYRRQLVAPPTDADLVPRAAVEATVLLESLCTWLLHRFGPESPEGKEASFRLTKARAALGGNHV